MVVKLRLWTAAVGFWLLLGCSAPHDNPLDPDSYLYSGPPPTEAALEGKVRSLHIARQGLSDTYSVAAELLGEDIARITEASVSFDGRAAVVLQPTSTGTLGANFSAGYFGDSQLGSVIGRPFLFTARNGDNSVHEIGPTYMWRVITGTPLVLSPSGGDTVSAQPVLEWEAFAAGFPFGYRADVVLITEAFETLVWSSALLPSGVLSVQPEVSLAGGDYYWTITVLDSFENLSRSKQGAFVVDTLLTVF